MTSSRRFAMPARRQAKKFQEASGPGSPVHLMQNRLGGLLLRMRNAVTFPVPMEAFLLTVYPEQLMQPIANREATPWDNLTRCLNTAEIAHFNVEGRGEHETFWVRHPKGELLPAPSDASVTLTFDKHNPHFDAVSKWIDTALGVQAELAAADDIGCRFLQAAMHPRHVENYWPELYPFVAANLEGRVRVPLPKINTRVLELPIKRTRDEIVELLAKCSLLPEAPCQAWVQYPRGIDGWV